MSFEFEELSLLHNHARHLTDFLKTGLRPARKVPCALSLLSAVGLLAVAAPQSTQAQGLLSVTPGRSIATSAGTGSLGYSGDGSSATAATLASPSAVAYDSQGNLYLADAANHVIREVVKTSGVVETIAGTGTAGFAGDGGAATAAQLDTPTGISVDSNGNLYIADSHNNRIRRVTSDGKISTIAGTGTAGFAGDGAAATAAMLDLPSALTVDASGNLFFADTNNQRIRRISSSGTISTIAGSGVQGYAGDGAAAVSADLDTPVGVAVDSAGNVYLADSHNHRIREVSTSGTIATVAGAGAPSFAGGFAGDGTASTAASLSKPTGVSIDSAGNVYIADTNNQRIRQLGGGVIATIAGTGDQGFGADGSSATQGVLNAPRAVAPDANGNLSVADTQNQRIRSGQLPTLAYTDQPIGVASSGQLVTVANTGTAAITVSNIVFAGPFALASGGSCSSAPITLAAGGSCTEQIAFTPAAIGASSGSVVFGGTGVLNQKILLTGNGTQAATSTTVTVNSADVFAGQSATFTAQVAPAGAGTPTGTIQFYSNGTALGSPITLLASGVAALTTSFASAGSYSITAAYSGDASFLASTSSASTEGVHDFTLQNTSALSQVVLPAATASYSFALTPLNGSFSYPITFTATGAPAGTKITFTPQSVTPGTSTANVSVSLTPPLQKSMLQHYAFPAGGSVALALLLLPFGRRFRRSGRTARWALLCCTTFGSLSVLSISGCGSGFLTQPQTSYTVTITATATGSNGETLQHTGTVTLVVE
ncbi:MAG: Ig-like domain repeat protein [Acidobacteriaceae bacterium]|nr:Ig-like domain repeat protein [Acidobacteriaceae bacterium]